MTTILLLDASARAATYADPAMRGKGPGEIEALIGAVLAKFPGFVFSLIAPADGHGSAVQFSLRLGAKGGEAVVKGTDFVTLDGDRIAAVTGFLDLVCRLPFKRPRRSDPHA